MNDLTGVCTMMLRYRVSLPGIKGFARVYDVKPSTTLYEFHKRMRDDMDFSHDQLILFKGLDNAGITVARYGMFNLGSGTVDEVTMQDTVKNGITAFTYFYNTTDRKSVIVTYEGEAAEVRGASYPLLVESKGPNPIEFENGFVAYEDLPDDQRHLPGESSWGKDEPAADENDDLSDIDEGVDDEPEENEEADEDDDPLAMGGEDEDIIFDGTEDLTL